MPKAAIYGNIIETYPPNSGGADEDTSRVQLAAQVGWDKGGAVVTMGVVGRDPEAGSPVGVPGFHMDLDWTGVNRLISELRNARDQAFGKPE